jgi:hypothetical protein
MLSQDRSTAGAALQDRFLRVVGATEFPLTGHMRARARVTRTFAVLRQCAWCGAIKLGGRFYLHHRISSLGWVHQLRVFSWLLLTLGISHGLCDRCADGIRQRHGSSQTGTASS